MRDLYQTFFVGVARVRGSVLLRHVYDRPHRVSPGRSFLPLKMHYRPGKGDGSAQRGRSMLSTIAFFIYLLIIPHEEREHKMSQEKHRDCVAALKFTGS